MRQDAIELLGESLIKEEAALALDILGFSTRYNAPLGWHYLLDFIWVLRELKNEKNLTILDAGAGSGLLQYILAEYGNHVISADMNKKRTIHPLGERLFHTTSYETAHHIRHHYFTAGGNHCIEKTSYVFDRFLSTSPKGLLKAVKKRLSLHAKSLRERHLRSKTLLDSFIKIDKSTPKFNLIFYNTDLRCLDRIEENSIDAVVSISAIEHNTPEEVVFVLAELNRVLKPDGKMLLTVSANHPSSIYHDPSHSWTLNEPDLVKVYGLREGYRSNFNSYTRIQKDFKNSSYLNRWLSHRYFSSSKNGMPNGIWNPCYLPVGLKIYGK